MIKNKKTMCILLAAISAVGIMICFSARTSNPIILLLVLALYLLYLRIVQVDDSRVLRMSAVLGFVFSGMVSVVFLVETGELQIFDNSTLLRKAILVFVGFFPAIGGLLVLFTEWLSNIKNVPNVQFENRKKKQIFWGSFAFIVLATVPYLFICKPGITTIDSQKQIMQAVGMAPYNNGHSILHTLIIKACILIGNFLLGNDVSNGILVYSIIQCILTSLTFSYVIASMYKNGTGKILIIISLAYFAILPLNRVYCLTMWKDIWFSICILLIVTLLWNYNLNRFDFAFRHYFLLILAGIGICLFRKNGFIVAFVLAITLFFAFHKKKQFMAFVGLIIVVISLFIKIPIEKALNVETSGVIEHFSLPAQHIAAAITDGADLSEEEYLLLSEVIDVDKIPEEYDPYICDPIKYLVWDKDNENYIVEHKKEFISLWASLGRREPYSYFKAQIRQTYGYWYPDVQYGVFLWNIADKADFSAIENSSLIIRLMYKFAYYMVADYNIFYFIGLLYSIGTMSWITIYGFSYCLMRKRKQSALVFVPILAIIVPLMIASPVYAEFRYVYGMAISLPVLFAVLTTENRNDCLGEAYE